METPEKSTPGGTDRHRAVARGAKHAGSGEDDTPDKVSNAAQPVVDRMASGAHEAVDKVADVANQAAESLGDKGDQLKEVVEHWSDYVRAHPIASLGIAVAAGFLLSRLISSR